MDAEVTTKTADKKGRVALGQAFANKTLIVNRISETKVVIETARVIPESEAWLWDNEAALASVKRGLKEARAQDFAAAPDVDGDLAGLTDDE